MNKILKSVAIIGFVAAVAIAGTGAYFSDTETSTGNTFTAGAIDLTVDSEQHYNGNVCTLVTPADPTHEIEAIYEWVGQSAYPVPGTPCDGTWEATDLGVRSPKFFNFSDIKPGDEGENTISLHINNNDAYVRLLIKDMADMDNGCNEPEAVVDTTCGTTNGEGELRENLVFSMWLDEGATAGFQGKGQDQGEGDNIKQDNEPELISAGTIDEEDEEDENGINEIWTLPAPLKGGATAYFGVAWNLPASVGNEVQTDSMSATMEFQVEQARNNSTPFVD